MGFSDLAARQARNEVLRRSRLVELDFKSGRQRYWPGMHAFEDVDGRRWSPTMGIAGLAGIEQALGGQAPQMTLELSGVDREFTRMARASADEYYGRICRVAWQWFAEDWAPLDRPVFFAWGLMSGLSSVRRSSDQGTQQSLLLTVESPFAFRARARGSYLTDTDQKMRSPGDNILSRVAGLEARLITWSPRGS